jgi:hypothetical protein
VARAAILAAAIVVAASLGCSDDTPQTPTQEVRVPAVPQQASSSNVPSHSTFPVRVDGTRFLDASGRPFHWRGITAFRLAEMIAAGREQEAVAYLDWAQAERLTVVRVLLMAQGLFKLTPEAGRAALPRLLDLAKARGLAVEVVALADTKDVAIDYDAHIRQIGRIALERGNAFVELANEPGHPTQDSRVHQPAFLQRLAAQLPEPVVLALGSFEYGGDFATGDYATTHLPRGEKDWDHVLAVPERLKTVIELRKPVVSDEPIGAGPEYQAGRRDNVPSRFAAAAALTRFVGMSATFHYEGGLQATIPAGREAACLAAWQLGLALLTDVPLDGEFVVPPRLDRIAKVSGARAAFGRVGTREAVILLIDPAPNVSVTFAAGWKETRRTGVPGVQIVLSERSSP